LRARVLVRGKPFLRHPQPMNRAMKSRVVQVARLTAIAGVLCAGAGSIATAQEDGTTVASTGVKVAQSTVTRNRPPATAKKPTDEATNGATPAPAYQFYAEAHFSESYVNNASGLARGARSDFITSLGLSAHVRDLTSRATLIGDYTFNADFYSNGRQPTQFTNHLLALADISAIPEYLTIGAKAFARPVVTSNLGIITAGDRLVANGFHSSYGFVLEPNLKLRFANFADSQTIPLYGATFFTRPAGSGPDEIIPGVRGPEDMTTRGVTQRFTSGEDFSRLSWNAIGVFVETKRKQGLLSDKEGTSTVKYAISHEFSLLATWGYAAITNTTPLAHNVSGLIAMGGFSLKLGPDLDLEIEVGQKYRDISYFGSLRYNLSPRTSIVGSANDTITTPEGQLLDSLDNLITTPNGDLTSNDSLLGNGLPASLSSFDFQSLGNLSFNQNISRNQTASLAFLADLERNHFNFSVFYLRRTFLSGILFGPPQTDAWGARAQFSRDITPVLVGSVRASYNTTQELGGTARIFTTGADLRYSLTPDMEVSFRGDYLDRHSSVALEKLSPFTGSLRDYRFTIYLSRKF
jgi:uncharacterized protein (PEP-CTERM system associated)